MFYFSRSKEPKTFPRSLSNMRDWLHNDVNDNEQATVRAADKPTRANSIHQQIDWQKMSRSPK